MSLQLISHSSDLQRLVDDGFEVEIVGGYLVLHSIPYVNELGLVQEGKLVCSLDMAGDKTVQPRCHVALFSGEHPCDRNGNKLPQLVHSESKQRISERISVDRSFSCKPKPSGKYDDYHHKMTTYAAMISVHAEQLDPNVSARTFRVIASSDEQSPFNYIDLATSRAGIEAHARKLELPRVAIVGLGGTGSYVLDFLAKTPVGEIHLYDGDWFLQHNAFRAPGAASIQELQERLHKVHYFVRRYAPMRIGLVPHPVYIDSSNVIELKDFDFVFLCTDGSPEKKTIVKKLEDFDVPFVDTGMGIEKSEDGLRGILRVTSSTPRRRDHVWNKARIPFVPADIADEYSSNVQVADLNAMSAVQAVIRFKKYFGFYADLECEHFMTYTLDGNHITNEES